MDQAVEGAVEEGPEVGKEAEVEAKLATGPGKTDTKINKQITIENGDMIARWRGVLRELAHEA